ncbi:preprotein translocase subunit SecY [symbiont of Argiope bruennichi]|uniref:preprotein translocase subunit SecY n=1 Tax=symbiont of Argiope bruennichi TaxID=2810479 RepID=UPI003DA1CAA9
MSLLETIKSCWIFKDLRKKIIFTIVILIFFRIGSNIPIPGINVEKDSFASGTDSFFGMMSMLGGGNLRKFSIFSLSVSPYVLATIIVQLLSADIIPSWTKLSKSGERGKKQLDLIARFLTIFIAIAQGFAMVAAMQSKGFITASGFFPFFNAVIILLFGSVFAIWLGDRISEHGVGNGTSMIIFSGIVANIPWNFFIIGKSSFTFDPNSTDQIVKTFLGVLNILIILILLPTIIILTIYLTQSVRKIPVQQLGSGMDKKKSDLENSYILLKINSSGVIPVIFASSLMSIPLTISQFFVSDQTANYWVQMFFSMSYVPALILYFTLVVLFTFFYSSIVIKPTELAKNFQRHGSFIPGVSPGTETKFYILRTLSRLNFLGGLSLAFIASLPYIIFMVIGVPSQLSIGGTGMIIMVGVAIDVVSQIQGRIIQKKYATLSDKSLINVDDRKLNFSDFENDNNSLENLNDPKIEDEDKKSLLW